MSYKSAPKNLKEATQISKGLVSKSIRETLEAREEKLLSPLATHSQHSWGREFPETPCLLRPAFQRDRDRILHCKAFRRLKHKTQVFISPVGDHYRTRLTHTLEVAQVSRTIARALCLNEDLTEAIALGHDLGHPPFGHTGERILNEIYAEGFSHPLQSLRIARVIERLNLSLEILDAMEKDTGAEEPRTLEGQIVKIADRMAYLHHDVEDAIRAGLMQESDLPQELRDTLGLDRGSRLDRMVIDMVQTSQPYLEAGEARLALSPDVGEAMAALRRWMFQNIYLSSQQQQEVGKVRLIIRGLFEHFCQYPEEMSVNLPDTPTVERKAVDYIAGMTDRFAIETYTRLFLPQASQPNLFGPHFFEERLF